MSDTPPTHDQQSLSAAPAAATYSDPRQQLLAAFTFGNGSKPASWTMQNSLQDWYGVRCTFRLTSLDLSFFVPDHHPERLRGTINWAQLPRSLRELHLNNNRFTGTVDWAHLPRSLTVLRLRDNLFFGTVDWAQLPRSLTVLDLYENDFTGAVDWKQLPRSLTVLDLYHNDFAGTVDWAQLPRTLSELKLSNNQFTGKVDLTQLPSLLREMYLKHNCFTDVIGDVGRSIKSDIKELLVEIQAQSEAAAFSVAAASQQASPELFRDFSTHIDIFVQIFDHRLDQSFVSKSLMLELAANTVPWIRNHNVVDAAETCHLWEQFVDAPTEILSRIVLLMIHEALWRRSIVQQQQAELEEGDELKFFIVTSQLLRATVALVAEHANSVLSTFLSRRVFGTPDQFGEVEQHACLICNRDFDDGQEVTETPCGHAFCSTPCAKNWFRDERSRCPTCRSDVMVIDRKLVVYGANTLRTFAVQSNVLNTGASAVTYKADIPRDDGQVLHAALKIYTKDAAHLMSSELRFLKSLRHEHILSAIGVCNEMPCIVMPLLTPLVDNSNMPLSAIQNMSLEQRILLCRDIAAALEFIHSRGKAHRDVKPHNVLLRQVPAIGNDSGAFNPLSGAAAAVAAPTPETRAVLGDLGSVRTAHSHMTGITYSPVFVAPEVRDAANDEKRLAAKEYLAADIFSAGRTFIAILTAQLPKDGAEIRSTTEGLAQLFPSQPQLVTLITCMVEKLPNRRPTARLVLHALNLLAGTPNASNRSEEELQCECCCSAPSNVAFVPCGHHVACSSCAERLRGQCPLCRTEITSVIPCHPEAPVFVGNWGSVRQNTCAAAAAAQPQRAQQQRLHGVVGEFELAVRGLAAEEIAQQREVARRVIGPQWATTLQYSYPPQRVAQRDVVGPTAVASDVLNQDDD